MADENNNVVSNIIKTTDLEPAISVDFTSRIKSNIVELQRILGIADMIPMAAGSTIKVYQTTVGTLPEQVAEGEEIELTKVSRALASTITLTLKKYRKQTTAEAIQRSGRDIAINETDAKLITKIQSVIKGTLYTALGTGSGTAQGATLQACLANLWAALQNKYEDEDVSAIYFVNPSDVASYLGSANISTQNAFGFSYVEDFLGLGTVVIAPQVTSGHPIATAKENLNGAYVPASGDLGQSFGLTTDESGLVGMTHYVSGDNASLTTLLMSGVAFFPEAADGIFIGTIGS